jgi:eukaryotic-like serine/threonine-protein kinase
MVHAGLCEPGTAARRAGQHRHRHPRPPPPSRVAGNRHRIPRDLDLIVARATHAEPERRYVSAAALADDLQRHLRGRPVQAAPDHLHYRAFKFVARHRFATAALLVAVAMAGVFTWRLASERDRALRAEAQAREQSATAESVVDYLVSLFRSASPGEAGTRAIAPRDLVDRGRREIDQRLADAPRQRARLLGALGKIYLELGLPDEAADTLHAASAIEAMHGTPRQQADYLLEQGFALNTAERPAEARSALEAAIAALGDITAEEYGQVAGILATLGLAQARNGDAVSGTATVRRSLDYAARASGSDSVPYAESLYALAETGMREGNLDSAEKDALRSLGILRRHLPGDSTEVIAAIGFLSQVYERQGRHAEAERLLRDMLDVRLRTLDPGSSWAITARNNLAQAIQLQGRLVEAMALMRENVDLLRKNGQQDSPSYLIGLNNLASLLETAGDHPTSLAMFEEAVAGAERQPDFAHARYFRINLGRSLMLNGRLDDARPLLETAIEEGEASLERDVERARRGANLAEWLRRSGRLDEALAQADAAVAAFANVYPMGHARQGSAASIRGLVLRDQGRLEEAAREFRRAADLLARFNGENANPTLDAELQLADMLDRLGKTDDARALHARMTPLLPARFLDGSPVRMQHAALGRRLQAHRVVNRS